MFFLLSNFELPFIQSSIRHALYQKWFRKVKFSTDLINVRGCYWALNRRNEPREWKLPPNKREIYLGECVITKQLPSLTNCVFCEGTRIVGKSGIAIILLRKQLP